MEARSLSTLEIQVQFEFGQILFGLKTSNKALIIDTLRRGSLSKVWLSIKIANDSSILNPTLNEFNTILTKLFSAEELKSLEDFVTNLEPRYINEFQNASKILPETNSENSGKKRKASQPALPTVESNKKQKTNLSTSEMDAIKTILKNDRISPIGLKSKKSFYVDNACHQAFDTLKNVEMFRSRGFYVKRRMSLDNSHFYEISDTERYKAFWSKMTAEIQSEEQLGKTKETAIPVPASSPEKPNTKQATFSPEKVISTSPLSIFHVDTEPFAQAPDRPFIELISDKEFEMWLDDLNSLNEPSKVEPDKSFVPKSGL